jgi:hypothetical protein
VLLASPCETCFDGAAPSDVVGSSLLSSCHSLHAFVRFRPLPFFFRALAPRDARRFSGQVVLEPPHRGDRDRRLDGALGLPRLAQRALKLTPPPSSALQLLPFSSRPPLQSLPPLRSEDESPRAGDEASAAGPAHTAAISASAAADAAAAVAAAAAAARANYKFAFAQDLDALLSRYETADLGEPGDGCKVETAAGDVPAAGREEAAEEAAAAAVAAAAVAATKHTAVEAAELAAAAAAAAPAPALALAAAATTAVPSLTPPLAPLPAASRLRGPGDALALALHQALLRCGHGGGSLGGPRDGLSGDGDSDASRMRTSSSNGPRGPVLPLARMWHRVVPTGLAPPPRGFAPLPGFAPPLVATDLAEGLEAGVPSKWPPVRNWQQKAPPGGGSGCDDNDGW